MKRMKSFITIFALVVLASCNNKKSKQTDEVTNTDSIDTTGNSKRPPADKIPGNDGRATTTNNGKTEKNEILANIDNYLVSKPTFDPPSQTGGIANAGVAVQNILPDITFQKAILEVSIMTAEGAEFRTDYYILQNIEPGDIKSVKVPNAARGNTIVCHIVKLKSDQLTAGEMILVGSHFVAK